ncbi:MAG: CPBP family intramembrane metalloprotease [Clostridia bacterium]|jgi:membrane protease YdiL (CAAX protease family)|nr:CPBP family intramembrane metalloprotease [Clostridia bacterium]
MDKFKKILVMFLGMLMFNVFWASLITFIFKRFFFFESIDDIGGNYIFILLMTLLSVIYINILKVDKCKPDLHKILHTLMGVLLGMTTLIVVGTLNLSNFDFFGIDVYSSFEIILSLIITLIFSVASAFAEELIFRGYMQQKMSEYLIKEGAIFISSIFMALYMYSLGYGYLLSIAFLFISIMLGYIYEVTNTIFVSFGYNLMIKFGFLSLIRVFKYKYVILPGILNYKMGIDNGVIILISMHILIVVTLIFIEKKHVIKKFFED